MQQASIAKGGCLKNDRNYAIVDKAVKPITGKTNAAIHLLRSKIDLASGIILLKHQDFANWEQFHIESERKNLEAYLSDFFKQEVSFIFNTTGRFLDEPDLSGVTLLSTSSLHVVTTWFPNIDLNSARQRFRANLEIETKEAFWEDRLFTHHNNAVAFSIGEVQLLGVSPCARCVVPSRDAQSGESIVGFAKTFAIQRKTTLPNHSTLEEKGHTYCLSVNLFVQDSEVGKTLFVGDTLEIHGEVDARNIESWRRNNEG